MSMTSTKSFSTKNAGVLVVAVFSLVVSIGLSQVSSVMAQDEFLNCEKGADESNDLDTKVDTSCNYEVSNVQRIQETNLKKMMLHLQMMMKTLMRVME